jgi:hypothetical protein
VSYENDEGAKVHGERRQPTTTIRKIQSQSIFVTSFFTTTPLTIHCSSIICHSTSSIPVKGEYRPSLKDCLITSGSSSKAPVSTSSKNRISHNLHRVLPATSNTSGARSSLCASLSRSLSAKFSLLSRSYQTRGGASTWAGTTHRRASLFEEKPNNTHKRV